MPLRADSRRCRGDTHANELLLGPAFCTAYELESLVGFGGSGRVCRALDRASGKTVAPSQDLLDMGINEYEAGNWAASMVLCEGSLAIRRQRKNVSVRASSQKAGEK